MSLTCQEYEQSESMQQLLNGAISVQTFINLEPYKKSFVALKHPDIYKDLFLVPEQFLEQAIQLSTFYHVRRTQEFVYYCLEALQNNILHLLELNQVITKNCYAKNALNIFHETNVIIISELEKQQSYLMLIGNLSEDFLFKEEIIMFKEYMMQFVQLFMIGWLKYKDYLVIQNIYKQFNIIISNMIGLLQLGYKYQDILYHQMYKIVQLTSQPCLISKQNYEQFVCMVVRQENKLIDIEKILGIYFLIEQKEDKQYNILEILFSQSSLTDNEINILLQNTKTRLTLISNCNADNQLQIMAQIGLKRIDDYIKKQQTYLQEIQYYNQKYHKDGITVQ